MRSEKYYPFYILIYNIFLLHLDISQNLNTCKGSCIKYMFIILKILIKRILQMRHGARLPVK